MAETISDVFARCPLGHEWKATSIETRSMVDEETSGAHVRTTIDRRDGLRKRFHVKKHITPRACPQCGQAWSTCRSTRHG